MRSRLAMGPFAALRTATLILLEGTCWSGLRHWRALAARRGLAPRSSQYWPQSQRPDDVPGYAAAQPDAGAPRFGFDRTAYCAVRIVRSTPAGGVQALPLAGARCAPGSLRWSRP